MKQIHPLTALLILAAMIVTADVAFRREQSLYASLKRAAGLS